MPSQKKKKINNHLEVLAIEADLEFTVPEGPHTSY